MEFAKTGHSREQRPYLPVSNMFIDGAPRLATGVYEVDEIDSFFPSLLLRLVHIGD